MNGYRKYGNKKIALGDGTKFDSKKEYARWLELQVLERAGQITELRRQVKFVLIPTQYEEHERYGKTGKRLKDGRKLLEQECSYIADFAYRDALGQTVVEDAKGVKTKEYIIKRKLMLERYGIQIREV